MLSFRTLLLLLPPCFNLFGAFSLNGDWFPPKPVVSGGDPRWYFLMIFPSVAGIFRSISLFSWVCILLLEWEQKTCFVLINDNSTQLDSSVLFLLCLKFLFNLPFSPFLPLSMKLSTAIFQAILAVFILCLGVYCDADGDPEMAPMEKTEKKALYSAVQGFVGTWWNGSDLYPDPCGWTPIQVWLPYQWIPNGAFFFVLDWLEIFVAFSSSNVNYRCVFVTCNHFSFKFKGINQIKLSRIFKQDGQINSPLTFRFLQNLLIFSVLFFKSFEICSRASRLFNGDDIIACTTNQCKPLENLPFVCLYLFWSVWTIFPQRYSRIWWWIVT